MAKFYGSIGFGIMTETAPGVWRDEIVSRNYYGDVTRTNLRQERSSNVNDNVSVSNSFSISGDAFLYENFMHVRYIEWHGQKWRVSDVDVQRPRLILNISGLYTKEGNGTVTP